MICKYKQCIHINFGWLSKPVWGKTRRHYKINPQFKNYKAEHVHSEQSSMLSWIFNSSCIYISKQMWPYQNYLRQGSHKHPRDKQNYSHRETKQNKLETGCFRWQRIPTPSMMNFEIWSRYAITDITSTPVRILSKRQNIWILYPVIHNKTFYPLTIH